VGFDPTNVVIHMNTFLPSGTPLGKSPEARSGQMSISRGPLKENKRNPLQINA
jgi:hypothetical protein